MDLGLTENVKRGRGRNRSGRWSLPMEVEHLYSKFLGDAAVPRCIPTIGIPALDQGHLAGIDE
jgi:hypothetical protein